MPKMKTHRGTAKRFKLTPSGKVKRAQAFKSHILEKKSPKRKRQLKSDAFLAKPDAAVVKRLLGK